MNNKKQHQDTLCIHAGRDKSDHKGALSTPIYQSSTFIFDSAEQGAARFAGEEPGYIYSRLGNPTVAELEQKVAALEKMEAAAATATGMAAVSGAVLSFLQAGDHVIVSRAIYGCSFALFNHQLPKFGIKVSFVDMTEPLELQQALQANTKMVFAETPINPNLVVLDLAMISEFCQNNGLISVVDNTFLSPILQNPADFGIDIVLHSATKFLNGHGDVVAGLIVSNQENIATIKSTVLKDIGGTMSPNDAWLILRGLKTLPIRMARHCQSAQTVAEYLEQHPRIKQVFYPGLPSHSGHQFLNGQMRGAGGVIGFELDASLQQSRGFINATQLFSIAVSLGDAESLIQHPASMTHSPYTAEERAVAGISDGLIRISVGLEQVQDLIADIDQAIEKAFSAYSPTLAAV